MFKTIKAKILFVIIFSLICIIITTILILYNNIEIDKIPQEGSTDGIIDSIKEKDVSGINLKGTYNQNDLLIEEFYITQEKVEIRYLQISGLKNKTIEAQINKEIKDIALNCYKDEIKDLDEVVNVYVYMWNMSNFANTLSFEIYYMAKINDNDDGLYHGFRGLNYDLNTGEKITFESLFTSNAPIENILRQSAYYSLVSNRTEDNLAGDFVVSNYGDIEDEIAEIIERYKKGKITQFTFSPSYIYIVDSGNENIYIYMEDFAEYIAIYNRYISEKSLYESDNIGIKNIYTLANRNKDDFYYQNYQNDNNYFIDITINFFSDTDEEFANTLTQKKIDKIEQEIKKIKQKANDNSNNFYILNYTIDIYTYNNLVNCCETGNTYVMSVHDFEENIEPIIIKYNRQVEDSGIYTYIYDFSKMLRVEPENVIEYYDSETGNKVVI